MKITKAPFLIMLLLLVFAGCSKDDSEADKNPAQSKEYTLRAIGSDGVTGSVTFTEKSDGTTSAFVEISKLADRTPHPVFIYFNDEAKGGEVAITLNTIDCDCQSATTEVSKLDNGVRITYQELVNFNGHLKVHQSETDMDNIIAQGNIGSNVN